MNDFIHICLINRLEVGQFFSDEPGYYQPGEFGIRLETVLRVVERNNLKYQVRKKIKNGDNF